MPAINSPQQPNKFNSQQKEDPFDYKGLLLRIRRWLWLIIVCALAGLAGGWIYLKKATPLYQATATLLTDEKKKVVKVEEVTQDGAQGRNEAINTLVASISSRSMLEFVVENEHLHMKPGLIPGYSGPAPSVARAAGYLGSILKASPRKDTRLVDLTISHPDPIIARDLATALAQGVIKFSVSRKIGATQTASLFLVQESERLKKKLQDSESALQKYRSDNDAVSLEDNQNLVVPEMKSTSEKLTAATAQRSQIEADLEAIKALSGNTNELLQLRSIASHPTVATTTGVIAAKEAEFEVLKQRYKPKHPKYILAKSELANLKDRLDQVLANAEGLLQNSYQSAKKSEELLQNNLKDQEKKTLALDKLGVSYKALKRDMETDKVLYEIVLARLKEVDLTKGLEDNTLNISDLPALPTAPYFPIASKILTSSTGIGLSFGLGLVFLFFITDRSLRTVGDTERILRLPVLTAVVTSKIETPAREAIIDPKGSIAESFRTLRAMASLLGREEDRRTFLITSAVPSEGKTFCACNYAASLASQGLKTLLIDADLRRPRVSKAMFGEVIKPGLTEQLLGKVTLAGAVHASGAINFDVLPAGESSPNPAELLSGPGFSRLLEEALRYYQYVVIDSSPVVAVSDPLLIAPLVNTCFLVVLWGETPATVTLRSLALLKEVGKSPSGIIFNKVPHKSSSYYYHYSPGYYGSEGVYGAKA